MDIIFERIKQRRIELGITQDQLATRLGLKSRAAVSAVEKGKCDMTTDRIERYASALQTTPAYLMGWLDDPNFVYGDTGNSILDSFTNGICKYMLEHPSEKNNDNDAFYDSLSDEQKTEFTHLYKKYLNASPEIRSAIELLLKAPNNSGSKED